MKLLPNFEDALIYATQAHCDQTRKKTGIPYIAHVLGVTAIALEYGANETEAIGALLQGAEKGSGNMKAVGGSVSSGKKERNCFYELRRDRYSQAL